MSESEDSDSASEGPPARVLFFSHSASLEGSALSLLKLVSALDRRRYEPVAVFREEGPVADALRGRGVAVHMEPRLALFGYCSGFHAEPWEPGFYRSLLRFPATAAAGFRWVRRLRPQIAHVNSLALLAVGIGTHLAGCRTILHIREQSLPDRLRIRAITVRALIHHFYDHVLAICQSNLDSAGVRPAYATVVPNWPDVPAGQEGGQGVRDRLGLGPDTRMALFVGGESEAKGTHVLLRAVAQVRTTTPFVVVLAGRTITDTRRRRTRLYARELHALRGPCAGRLVEIGPLSSVGEWYAACDFVLFPSTLPHFPTPVIEAAVHGKPAVAANDEVCRELIAGGETGLLFTPGDAGDLAAKMRLLLEDSALADALGRRARARILPGFDRETSVQRVESVYRHLLARAGNAGELARAGGGHG